MPSKPLRLITLPISHYCEKVRWALDRQGIPYVEETHAPLLHAFFTMPLTGWKSRTVPILVDENFSPRRVMADSTDCLRYLAEHYGASWLYAPPEAAQIAEELDQKLGPATRRFAYFYLLPDERSVDVLTELTPSWEAAIARPLFPLVRWIMKRGMRIDATGAERSLVTLREIMNKYSERLADGRPYLCGDAFSAADLSLATLAVPVLFPKGYAKITMRDISTLAAPLRSEIERQRESRAGQLVMRLFAQERTKTLRSA
jgi:glutathione S-transferase